EFIESAGLSIGDRVTVRGPDQSYTLTGAVELPADLKAESLYAVPGSVIAPWQKTADRDRTILPPQASDPEWLVRAPTGAGVTWQDVLAANERGVLVESRRVVLDPPPTSEVPMAALMGDSY
ncbi:ABC transporter permease, partial [Streptomyces sp. SID7499]|nr:ABC transporter permease [Streptomyces sp. SID7499]